MLRLLALASLSISFSMLGSCSSSGASSTPDAVIVDPTVLRVGGEYPTSVTLESSTCNDIQVMSNPTSVRHTPGETTVTLTHAQNSYPGTVQRDGSFTTTPVPITVQSEVHTLTIAGQFSTTGFTAAVTVEVTRNSTPVCGYLVRWTATKQGSANVIPG